MDINTTLKNLPSYTYEVEDNPPFCWRPHELHSSLYSLKVNTIGVPKWRHRQLEHNLWLKLPEPLDLVVTVHHHDHGIYCVDEWRQEEVKVLFSFEVTSWLNDAFSTWSEEVVIHNPDMGMGIPRALQQYEDYVFTLWQDWRELVDILNPSEAMLRGVKFIQGIQEATNV